MTTQKAYDRFRVLYQEKSQRHFDTVTWAPGAINDSVDALDSEISDLHPEFMGMLSGNLSYAANVQEVALNAALSEVIAVEVTDRGGPPYPRLFPADFRDRNQFRLSESADWMAGSGVGEPTHYYVRGTTPASGASLMGFIPIPSRSAANNITVWFHGTRTPITVLGDTANDELDLPVLWHPLVPWHMCILAAGTDERAVLQYFVGMYNSRLEKRLAQALRGQAEYQHELIRIVD